MADIFLSDKDALEAVLGWSLVSHDGAGPEQSDYLWLGTGTYWGWQGFLAAGRFDRPEKRELGGVFVIIDHFDEMENLFEPPRH